MATGQLTGVIRHLRKAALLRDRTGMTDGQLLKDYISRHDEASLSTLVARHAPMVWGVCRRVVGNYHDAEDACQATFLVLVRRAASIAAPELVANWLYGVAHQTAMKAKSTVAKRRVRERQVTDMPEPAAVEQDLWNDLQPLLDQELSRLPDIYRVVIVLCELEGKTRNEAARHLGLPEGTVGSRLARARAILAKRLSRRGVTVSSSALAAVLSQNVALAGVPDVVASSTISVANFAATGQAAAGVVSPKVAALADGVVKAMLVSKLKAASVLLLVIGILGWGGGAFVWQIQAKAHHGLPLVEIENEQSMPDLSGTWRGDGWGTVVLRTTKKGTFEGTYTDTYGKDVGRIAVQWSTASRRCEGTWGEGKFRFGRIALEAVKGGEEISGAYTTDPNCEHQPGVPSLASLRWSRARPSAPQGGQRSGGEIERTTPRKQEEEGIIAWGKEVGGLQAGLGFRSGQKRAYTPGETVKLVVRVRNVAKEGIKIQYVPQFFIETPPAVTDDKGTRISLLGNRRSNVDGPVALNLAPGQEIELAEVKLDLRSGAQSVNDREWTLYGTGKFLIEYERVMYSSGRLEIDPILGKLATGKLELESTFDRPPATRKETPQNKDRDDASMKPIKIRVYIEKVNLDASTITASCMLIGEFDPVTKPVRLENLPVSEKTRVTDRGKELKLTDLKLLPRDTHFYLFLKVYEEGLGFEVVGIERISK